MGRDIDAEYSDLLDELQALADEDDPHRLHADRIWVIRLRMAQLQRDRKMELPWSLSKPVVVAGKPDAGRVKRRVFWVLTTAALLVVGLWLWHYGLASR